MRHNQLWSTVAASVVALTASAVFAQVQQLNVGRALDANSGVGTGGSNKPVPGYVPLNGNEVISGNVSGLQYFHGPSAIRSTYQFQGNLPSASLSNFSRQSSGGVGSSSLSQVYYLPSSTVSTSQGGLYSAPLGSGFDSQLVPRTALSPTISPTQVRSLFPPGSAASGRAFDRMTAGTTPLEAGQPGALLSSPLFSLRLTDQMPELNAGQTTSGKTPGELEDGTLAPKKVTRDQTIGTQMTGRIDPRLIGQSNEIKTAQLTPRDKPQEDVRLADSYRTLLSDLKKAETEANGGKELVASASGTEQRGTNMLRDIDPLTGRPRATTLKKPNIGMGETDKAPDKTVKGELPTKRLDDLSIATLTAGNRVKPLKTFVPQREDGQTTPVDVLIARAEASLKQGKYLEAAESYQLALSTDPNNALALVGRAHAELGAGMYQSAAYDLKFVFTRNPQMVGVRYEMDAFIPPLRQDFLMKDLAMLSNGKDMVNVASFLLSYLYYQTGKAQMLQSELQKWGAREGKDNWQTVLNRAWNGNKQEAAPEKPK